MTSFGSLAAGFADGFEGGYRLGLATRQQNVQDHRYGKPPDDEVQKEAGFSKGSGEVPVIEDPTIQPDKKGKDAEAAPTEVDPTTTGSVKSASDANPMPNAGGRSIGSQMYSYYRSMGLSHAASAGIAGNLMQESGGDPRVVSGVRRGDNGASAFLAQWQGQRLANLYKFAGTQQPTLKQQLDFVLEEMNPHSPFADPQAAAAGQQILGAQDVATATQLFRDHFERPSADDINSRLKYANSFGDEGGGDTPFSFDDAAAAPEKKEEPDFADLSGGKKSGGGGGEFAEASPIPVPELPQLSFTGWQQYAEPEWEEPLMAASGGVIPDYDPTAKQDAFRALANATPPGMSASTGARFTPRKIGTPSPAAIQSGPTASQTAFRALPKYQMPDRSQPAAAAALPANVVTFQDNPAPIQTAIARQKHMMYGSPWEGGHSRQNEISQERNLNRMRATNKARVGGSRHAEGGIVSYAEGGKVDKVKERTRQERTQSSRGDDAGQTARDRAVRRTNIEEKNRSSTALDTDGYWKPRGPKGQKKDTPRSRAKSGSGGEKPKPKYESTPGDGRVPIPTARPPRVLPPDLAVSPNRPDNRPSPNAPTNNPPTPRWGPPGRLSPENAGTPPSSAPPPFAPGASGGSVSAAPARRPMSPPGGRLSPENAPPPRLAQAAGTPRRQLPQIPGVPSGGDVYPNSPELDMMPTSSTGRPRGSAQLSPNRPTEEIYGKDITTPNTPQYTTTHDAPRDQRPIADLLSEIELLSPEIKAALTKHLQTGMTAGQSPMQQFRQGEVRSQGGQVPISQQLSEIDAFPDGVLETGMEAGSSPMQDFRQQEVQGQGGQRSIQDMISEISMWPDWMKQDLLTNLTAPAATPRAGYASGGIIPDSPMVSPRAESANYQRPSRRPLAPSAESEGAAAPEGPDMEPTPRLLQDVGKALDGGIRFLTRTFGLDGGGGVVDDPQSPQTKDTGMRRMMSGEGRADPQEVQGIYDRIDPDRQMSEGQRYMTSLAKTMQWYLRNGRKDDAEGVAASMMLYGQDRMGKLGSMASAAYKHYQTTGDPQGLEDAVGYLEKAYEYIPDGGDFDVISLDPETGQLVTVHRDAEGNEQQMNISPEQLPQLLQQVTSGSAYWKSITSLADPEGSRQRERFSFDLAKEGRTEQRERAKEGRTKDWWYEQQGVTQGFQESQQEDTQLEQRNRDALTRKEKLADEAAKTLAEQNKLTESRGYEENKLADQRGYEEKKLADQRGYTEDQDKLKRAQSLEDKILNEYFLRGRPAKAKDGAVDVEALNPLLQQYMEESGKGTGNQPNIDKAGSALVDALMEQGGGLKWLTDQGIWPNSDFTYTGGGGSPPAEHPDAQPGFDPDGNPGWYIPDPNRPGKMMLVPE